MGCRARILKELSHAYSNRSLRNSENSMKW